MTWHEILSDIVLLPAGVIYTFGIVTGLVVALFITRK